ncbi:MAG: GAF domain-containing protein [Acetobacteraceae bacterium]
MEQGSAPNASFASYEEIAAELAALLDGETDPLANVSNAAAAIFHGLSDVNWVGFYVLRGEELVLGPFQGRPACIRLPLGHGVCGTAAAELRSVLVDDVAAFPGHIACDPVSRSELVVPVTAAGRLVGVLDLDSSRVARFTLDDQSGCERLAALVAPYLAEL